MMTCIQNIANVYQLLLILYELFKVYYCMLGLVLLDEFIWECLASISCCVSTFWA